MTDTELKPCPFCGGTPEMLSGGPGSSFFRCRNCNSASDDRSKSSASHLWNTRPTEDALKARIAELESDLKIAQKSTNAAIDDYNKALERVAELEAVLESYKHVMPF